MTLLLWVVLLLMVVVDDGDCDDVEDVMIPDACSEPGFLPVKTGPGSRARDTRGP